MENFYTQMFEYSIELEKDKIKFTLLFSFLVFGLLIIYIRLIELHPHSVWYYFLAGCNSALLIVLSHSRSVSKQRIKHAENLKSMHLQANKVTHA